MKTENYGGCVLGERNKGTGKWTDWSARWIWAITVFVIRIRLCALHLFVESATMLPHLKVLSGPAQPAGDKAEFIEKVRRALCLGKDVSYARGALLAATRRVTDEKISLGSPALRRDFAKILRAGCIIRAQFLQESLMLREKRWYCQFAVSGNLLQKIADEVPAGAALMLWLRGAEALARCRRSLRRWPAAAAIAPQYCQLT